MFSKTADSSSSTASAASSSAGKAGKGPTISNTLHDRYAGHAPQRHASAGAAADTAQQQQDEEREHHEKLRRQMVAEAQRVAQLVKQSVTVLTHIPASDATRIIGCMRYWQERNMLGELVAELRDTKIQTPFGMVFGNKPQTVWRFLVSALDDAHLDAVWALLSKHNINAKNWGRLTDDLNEYWDVRMAGDVSRIRGLWQKLKQGEDDEGSLRRQIISVLEKYMRLDRQFHMSGTLLSRFLLRADLNTTKSNLVLPDEASTLIRDLKEDANPMELARLMLVLEQSNLVLLKQEPPPDSTLGEWVMEQLADFADRVDGLITLLANVSRDMQRQIWEYVCAVEPSLIIDVMISCAETFMYLTGISFALIAGDTLVRFFAALDYARLAKFIGALMLGGYLAVMSPVFFPVFALLPKEHQKAVLRLIDDVVMSTLLSEFRAVLVPIMRDLISDCWPVGYGISLDRAVGVAPAGVFAQGDKYYHLIRCDADSLVYRERVQLRGGVVASTGSGSVKGGVNKPAGKHKKGEGGGKQDAIREQHVAQAQAGLSMMKVQEAEFPIMDDGSFSALLLTLLELDELVTGGAYLFDSLADVDPMKWMKETKIEFGAFAEAAGQVLYGQVNTGADTRTNGEQTWDHTSGRPDLGETTWTQRTFGTLSATVHAFGSLGGSVELKQSRDNPDVFDVMLEAKARALLASNISVPGLGPLTGLLPQVDREVGVRLTYKMAGVREQTPELLPGKPTFSLTTGSGDLETHEGAGSEAALHLSEPDPAVFEDLGAFRKSIRGVSLVKRFGVMLPRSGAMWRHVTKQRALSAALSRSKSATNVGINAEAYVDMEIELDADRARQVFDIMVAAVNELRAEPSILGRVRDDLGALLSEGTVPSYLQDVGRVADIMLSEMTKATLHVEGGLRAGGGRREFEFHGGAQIIYQLDITGELAARIAAWRGEDILALVTGGNQAVKQRISEVVGTISPRE